MFDPKNYISKAFRKKCFSDFLKSGFHFLEFQVGSGRLPRRLQLGWAGKGADFATSGPGKANGKANLTHAPLDLPI